MPDPQGLTGRRGINEMDRTSMLVLFPPCSRSFSPSLPCCCQTRSTPDFDSTVVDLSNMHIRPKGPVEGTAVELAGFASQVLAIRHLEEDAEDVGGDGGDGSDEEVDQLDPSDGIIPEARATARVPNKTQPLFDESRQSSPEAETEMETVTQLAGGHASTSAIDITTAADDLFDDSQPGPPIFDPAKHTSSAL